MNGSTRAELHTWEVDTFTGSARIVREKRRQLYSMDKRLDVKPIAASLVEAILAGKLGDERLKWNKDGTVSLRVGNIIPETVKETTAKRRDRLRRHLVPMLQEHGWRMVRVNTFGKSSPE